MQDCTKTGVIILPETCSLVDFSSNIVSTVIPVVLESRVCMFPLIRSSLIFYYSQLVSSESVVPVFSRYLPQLTGISPAPSISVLRLANPELSYPSMADTVSTGSVLALAIVPIMVLAIIQVCYG